MHQIELVGLGTLLTYWKDLDPTETGNLVYYLAKILPVNEGKRRL